MLTDLTNVDEIFVWDGAKRFMCIIPQAQIVNINTT